MQLNKKENTVLFEDDKALDFEASLTLMSAKSEYRAWNITKGACALTLLSWTALVLLMPLKTEVPYVALVNEVTGYTQLLTTLSEETLTKQEALDAFWVGNYVRTRENYDWYTIQEGYDTTLLMSNANVAQEYAGIFEGDDALDVLWGKRIKAQVRLLSKPIIKNNIATVRFEKNIKSVEDNSEGQSTVWIATLAFNYKTEPQSDEARLKNPLGFEVVSYRLDPELME